MKVRVVDVGGTNVQWRRDFADVVARLMDVLQPDDVFLGGGNVNKLKTLPPGCRSGDNANAFFGGLRLWETGKTAACRLSETSLPEIPERKEEAPGYKYRSAAAKPRRGRSR